MSDLTPPAVQNGYIVLPITTDPDAMVQAALAAIAEALPGWVPQEGQLDVLLLEQFAQMASESAAVAAVVPLSIFQYFGSLVGINPIDGSAAMATSTWTMIDTAGYTVPAGTLVAYQTLGNVQVQFQTVDDFTIASGDNTATGIELEASVVGAINNGIVDTTPVVLVNQLAFVSSVVATSTTSGGSDPETLSTYLNRLSSELRLLTPRPILPQDFAALAPQVPGVYRAMAINLLNPGRTITDAAFNNSTALNDPDGSFTVNDIGKSVSGNAHIPGSTVINAYVSGTQVTMNHASTGGAQTGQTVVLGDLTGVERCVTVGAVDIDGNALSDDLTAALQAYLEAQREINFLVFVIAPTYTEIDVTWTGVAQIGADIDTVQDAGNAALETFLSSAVWGTESVEVNGTTTADSSVITGIVVPVDASGNPAFNLEPGMPIFGYGVQADATIQSLNEDGSVNMSLPATAGGTSILTVILDGTWDPRQNTVRFLQVSSILGQTPGLAYVTALTINVHGDSPDTIDIPLSGNAPLTSVGDISGVVSPHS